MPDRELGPETNREALAVLPPVARDVYLLALELQEYHQNTWLEKLPREAKRRLHLTRRGVDKALRVLTREKFVVPASQLTRDDILANATRRAFLGFIREHPGAHFREILAACDLKNKIGVGRWHLKKLLSFGFIEQFRFGKYLCYFPRPFDSDQYALYSLAREDTIRGILEFLTRQPDSKLVTIARALAVDPSTVSYHVKKLERLEVVCSHRHGNSKRVGIREEVLPEVARVLEH